MTAAEESNLGQRVEELDVTLFDPIEGQTTVGDRKSLLALHAACREVHGSFAYLEIGSHRGGSLQALVRDPLCESIVSIDARPERQPDERGREYIYEDNSTEAMLRRLAELPGADASKIVTADESTDSLDPASIGTRPALCFVDAEHTDAALVRDGLFCSAVLEDRGAIAFHDAQIVYGGIARFLQELLDRGAPIHPYVLPDSIFVVELGEPTLLQSPQVEERIGHNWQAFLFALQFNDGYRSAMNRPFARVLRRARLLPVEGVDDTSPAA
jgi:hypothetical protein